MQGNQPNQGNRTAEVARALGIKRNNAIVAIGTGVALAVVAAEVFAHSQSAAAAIPVLLLGLFCGIVYANAFEYALHRWFLHWGDGFLVQSHALHHDSVGRDDEPRYVLFASSFWVVVLLFVSNAAPVFLLLFLAGRWSRAFSWGIFGAGIFAGFTAYYVLYEEIHWRMHMGGWLPSWLAFSQRHHLLHHGDFPGHYNVFLPLFDWIFSPLDKNRARKQSPIPH